MWSILTIAWKLKILMLGISFFLWTINFKYSLYVIFLGRCLKFISKIIASVNRYFLLLFCFSLFWSVMFFMAYCYVFIVIVYLEEQHNKCIVLNWSLATAIAVVRSVTDFIYLLHIFLQVWYCMLMYFFNSLNRISFSPFSNTLANTFCNAKHWTGYGYELERSLILGWDEFEK